MASIPEPQALADALEPHFEGRRVRAAAFLTFTFEPDFFELYILPVLLPGLQLSPADGIALWQLEDALRSQIGDVAVYYDRRALVPRERSARLDVRRIPCVAKGYFHPKVLLAVTEPTDAESAEPERLVVLVTSANLTQAGWWENVEIAHIEIVDDGSACSFRGELRRLINVVRRDSPDDIEHPALDEVERFVRGLKARKQQSSGGVLHPQLFVGPQPLAEWLRPLLPSGANDICMEVISPYFDATDAKPLQDLIDVVEPSEVRVFLPEMQDGTAGCEQRYFDVVAGLENASWGRLPAELFAFGTKERLKQRTVHAKVYRLFDRRARYEAMLVGSVNLTNAAHGRGGNLEAAFLIESADAGRPDWWLTPLARTPQQFAESGEAEPEPQPAVRISLRFDWSDDQGVVYWDHDRPSSTVEVTAQGAPLFTLESLPPREWVLLQPDQSESIAEALQVTSFLHIREPAGEYTILVDETGMARKPSVRHELSAADILKSWSLFTPEQRSAFVDMHGSQLAETMRELGFATPILQESPESFFDLHAGVFLAFGNLERRVKQALYQGRTREVEYWLFGRQYDSLLTLMERARAEAIDESPVREYLMMLCARQLVEDLLESFPELAEDHAQGVAEVRHVIAQMSVVRERFTFDTAEDRQDFFQWFEKWFLARAQPVEPEAA